MLPAVRAAFSRPQSQPPSSPSAGVSEGPTASRGGLELLYHAQLGGPLSGATASPCCKFIAVSTDEGSVVLLDGTKGDEIRRTEPLADDAPNAIAWSIGSTFLVCCGDDAYARVVAVDSGAVVFEHLISEEPAPGKRRRCVPSEHVIVVDETCFVAAAGAVIHACGLLDGQLRHAISTEAPVRALCRSPTTLRGYWAYAAAYKGGVLLVSQSGESHCKLYSRSHLQSLAVSDQCLAAAGVDGTVELWDDTTRATGPQGREAKKTVQTFCGSDGAALAWSADGGGLAISGKRAAVVDCTGSNPHHPYRSAAFGGAAYLARPGEPDPVPRVCMGDGSRLVAWTPSGAQSAETALATAGKDGVVTIWRPWGVPLRKGGVGNPAQAHRMKPQFYTYAKADAAPPMGEERKPCALMWLTDKAVAVCYQEGDIVAWRLIV